MELAREAEEALLRIEADNGARYVQLANVYAAEGNWREMCRIRGKMRGGEVRKLAGCSWSQWFSSMKKEYLKFSAPWSGWYRKFYHTVAMLQFYEKINLLSAQNLLRPWIVEVNVILKGSMYNDVNEQHWYY
ncbi:hypothetical protein IFM89_006656 [Coptis chinensis]|uniref:Uncharacterized protein n=1 Tax=Coptis chinensis TaxID=261450 RepID=A0A835IUJ6_9MAGN|nr:hypothetical protein IFM89_006656 [Coptis chinensis]